MSFDKRLSELYLCVLKTEKEIKKMCSELSGVVAKAAIASFEYIGTGEKEAGDQAAVDAMRSAFDTMDIDGVVRVGEGEKDEAPMLYVGEKLGSGDGPRIDIAVDPIEGTSLMAAGKPNAISVIAATVIDGFWDAASAYYMDKIVVDHSAKGVIDINASVEKNIQEIAEAKGKPVSDVCIYILNKPRHVDLIRRIENVGAKVAIHDEGDVIGSVLALMPDSDIDALMGTGGAPEAVITAAAVKALGGGMQGKLAPQKEEERRNLLEEGADLDRVFFLEDLVKSEHVVFAAAGVTDGLLLKGLTKNQHNSISTETIVISSRNNGQLERREFTS